MRWPKFFKSKPWWVVLLAGFGGLLAAVALVILEVRVVRSCFNGGKWYELVWEVPLMVAFVPFGIALLLGALVVAYKIGQELVDEGLFPGECVSQEPRHRRRWILYVGGMLCFVVPIFIGVSGIIPRTEDPWLNMKDLLLEWLVIAGLTGAALIVNSLVSAKSEGGRP